MSTNLTAAVPAPIGAKPLVMKRRRPQFLGNCSPAQSRPGVRRLIAYVDDAMAAAIRARAQADRITLSEAARRLIATGLSQQAHASQELRR